MVILQSSVRLAWGLSFGLKVGEDKIENSVYLDWKTIVSPSGRLALQRFAGITLGDACARKSQI